MCKLVNVTDELQICEFTNLLIFSFTNYSLISSSFELRKWNSVR